MKPGSINVRYLTLLPFCIILSFVMAVPVYPAEELKLKPGAKGELCLKCHEPFQETLKSRYLHPLMKNGECTGCHTPHTSSHESLLIANSSTLCQECHRDVMPEQTRSSHKNVLEGKCNQCHKSHGSDNRFILAKSGNELCVECHKDVGDNASGVQFRHEPLEKDKGCLNCHNPHASKSQDFLLKNVAPLLCTGCHETGKPVFKEKHENYSVSDTNCSSCHASHGSNKRGMLFDDVHAPVAEKKCTECHEEPGAPGALKARKQGMELCRECHKDMIEKTLSQNRLHWPLFDGVGCLNCHSPHATKQKKLLKGTIPSVCGECHGDTLELQEWSKNNPKNKTLCEPVKTGNCITCHSPHAGDNMLLISAQPSVSIGLCGECHEWQTHSTHPIGEDFTDQRNENLTVECLSCHRACGTGNKPMMMHFDTINEMCIQCHTERKR